MWHRRVAHINMEHLNKLISKDLVIGLPKLRFEKDRLCDACQKGKYLWVPPIPCQIWGTKMETILILQMLMLG